MNKKINLIQKLNIHKVVILISFTISLIFLFSPYLSGLDLRIVKIPVFKNSIAGILKVAGPLLSIISIFLLVPMWSKKIKNDNVSSSVNKNNITKFSGTKSERLIDDQIESNINANESRQRNIARILRQDIKSEDIVCVKTENSTYKITRTQNEYYKVTGGWFNKAGRSGSELRINGCVKDSNDNSLKKKVYKDYLASCNMCIKFGNGLITSPVKKITIRKIDNNKN